MSGDVPDVVYRAAGGYARVYQSDVAVSGVEPTPLALLCSGEAVLVGGAMQRDRVKTASGRGRLLQPELLGRGKECGTAAGEERGSRDPRGKAHRKVGGRDVNTLGRGRARARTGQVSHT